MCHLLCNAIRGRSVSACVQCRISSHFQLHTQSTIVLTALLLLGCSEGPDLLATSSALSLVSIGLCQGTKVRGGANELHYAMESLCQVSLLSLSSRQSGYAGGARRIGLRYGVLELTVSMISNEVR